MDEPTVTVVVVNEWRSGDVAVVVDALRRLDWPADRLEVLVVATGSASMDELGVVAPGTTIVLLQGATRGAARNCGAAKASGFYVAFAREDSLPEPNWLRCAVDALMADGSIACAASEVSDWDGRRRLYPGGGTTFDGHPIPVDETMPALGARDVLHPHSAGLVMPRSLFTDIGGFDERLGGEGEDLDLGWRLWLLGYRVRLVPDSVIRIREHDRLDAAGSWYRQYLQERNALITLYKHLDDINLPSVLAGAALMTVRRGMEVGEVARGELDPANGIEDGLPDEMAITRRGAVPLHALDDFLSLLPTLEPDRADLQSRRRRTDAEILARFGASFTPSVPSGNTEAGLAAVRDGLGLGALFEGRRRVLVLTADVLGPAMAGPAIRAVKIAQALAAEHDVTLASSNAADLALPGVNVEAATSQTAMERLAARHDVVVFQGYILELYPILGAPGKVVVADLYDPFHLEQLEHRRDEPVQEVNHVVLENVRVLNEQLSRADLILCASERQRDFWLGQLSALRRLNPRTYEEDDTMNSLIAVVPFGVEDEPPVRTGPGVRGVIDGIGADDLVLLWGGGIYNWFDPGTLIRAVDRLRHELPRVRLVFMGTKHPNPEVPAMRVAAEARELAQTLGLLGRHVFFLEGWVPYTERQNILLDADVGVSTHVTHLETAFSFRTRLLDYFWAGLPVVCTEGDALASEIARRGAGRAVPSGDIEALVDALRLVLTDEAVATSCREESTRLADELRWRRVLEPLIRFCRHARCAPDAMPWAPVPVSDETPTPTPLPPQPARGAWRRVGADLATARTLARDGGWRAIAAGVRRRARRLAGTAPPS